jgi:hypothetical protein
MIYLKWLLPITVSLFLVVLLIPMGWADGLLGDWEWRALHHTTQQTSTSNKKPLGAINPIVTLPQAIAPPSRTQKEKVTAPLQVGDTRTKKYEQQTSTTPLTNQWNPQVFIEPNTPMATLAIGTRIPIHLLGQVNTSVNEAGQMIEALLSKPIYLRDPEGGNWIVLHQDTRFTGYIDRLEAPTEGRNAVISFRITKVTLHNGKSYPMVAYIRGEHPDHTFGGELTEGRIQKTVIHRPMGLDYGYAQLVWMGPRRMGENIQFSNGYPMQAILQSP